MDMPSMQYRHNRGDAIETWKFVTGKYDTKSPQFKLASGAPNRPSATRGNSLKLMKERDGLHMSRFLSKRVVNSWNALSPETVTAPNINVFKNRLDAEWKKQRFRTPYGPFADYRIDE